MKRLLYVSLVALVVSANIQARDFDYYAVFKNPTGLKTYKEKEGLRGELKVLNFVNHPNVKVGQTTNKPLKVIENKLDLIAATTLPENTNYSIVELPMENNERVFQACIKKQYLAGFDPSQGAMARWGFKNAASVEDKGAMWCFTLKNNQGYIKRAN